MSIISRLFPVANDATATQTDIDDGSAVTGDGARDGAGVDSAPTNRSGSRKRRGATAIELILYIGGAALVVTGAILGYQSARSSIEFSKIQGNIFTHATNLRAYVRHTPGEKPALVSISDSSKSPWKNDIYYFYPTEAVGKFLIYDFTGTDPAFNLEDCITVVQGQGKIDKEIIERVVFSSVESSDIVADNVKMDSPTGTGALCAATDFDGIKSMHSKSNNHFCEVS